MDLMEVRRQMMGVIAMAGWQYIKTYTVPESWENDNKGNAYAVIRTVMQGEQTDIHDLYALLVENNTAQSYVCNCIIFSATDITKAEGSMGGALIRNNYTNVRNISASSSSWISQGATIKVYKTRTPA